MLPNGVFRWHGCQVEWFWWHDSEARSICGFGGALVKMKVVGKWRYIRRKRRWIRFMFPLYIVFLLLLLFCLRFVVVVFFFYCVVTIIVMRMTILMLYCGDWWRLCWCCIDDGDKRWRWHKDVIFMKTLPLRVKTH